MKKSIFLIAEGITKSLGEGTITVEVRITSKTGKVVLKDEISKTTKSENPPREKPTKEEDYVGLRLVSIGDGTASHLTLRAIIVARRKDGSEDRAMFAINKAKRLINHPCEAKDPSRDRFVLESVLRSVAESAVKEAFESNIILEMVEYPLYE